jgi:hypothetical protein
VWKSFDFFISAYILWIESLDKSSYLVCLMKCSAFNVGERAEGFLLSFHCHVSKGYHPSTIDPIFLGISGLRVHLVILLTL